MSEKAGPIERGATWFLAFAFSWAIILLAIYGAIELIAN